MALRDGYGVQQPETARVYVIMNTVGQHSTAQHTAAGQVQGMAVLWHRTGRVHEQLRNLQGFAWSGERRVALQGL